VTTVDVDASADDVAAILNMFASIRSTSSLVLRASRVGVDTSAEEEGSTRNMFASRRLSSAGIHCQLTLVGDTIAE